MKREDVYKLIDGERAYQDGLGTDRVEDNRQQRTVCEELVLLQVYVQRAMVVWANTPGDSEAEGMMRKIAGIAVRCMENHDAPGRK